MYDLFTNTPVAMIGVEHNFSWMYLKPSLARNVHSIVSYYRRNPMAVKSQHLLVRLLHTVNIPKSQVIERYYSNVDSIALNVGMFFGLSSPISKGKIFNGVFYGGDNKEIIIADNSEFDPIEADKNWENLEPIRVLRHPKSDLNMNIPNGVSTSIEDGISVIMINITMLAIQYRAFRREENKLAFRTGSNEKSIMQFLHMYPLTNMIRSHLDVAIFNRLNNTLNGRPNNDVTLKHPCLLVNYNHEVDKFIDKTITELDRVKKDFYDLLHFIPAVNKDNMLEVMSLPDIPPTRQVMWSLSVSRLNCITFLLQVSNKNNQTLINKIKRRIKELKTDRVFESVFSQEPILLLDIESEINTIEKLIG